MFEPYSNQGTQMWGHGGSPHAPTLGVLADFLTQEVGLFPYTRDVRRRAQRLVGHGGFGTPEGMAL